ncbi:DUF4350 domain-containing protein [Alkalinema sp. FACHB-956]|uniref:DUF4350 domain-containing protein n=1 Tax=Alkalinema sp. FACHB-956 TaxID=2692768 RepID=UPI001681D037|nr:DUF4350 domain-containing protein [Alkalinema sp. FACHB-956]MBD2328113.1 DUF4350 domain-containing protein [Alkalinema sp. FACHB-956]
MNLVGKDISQGLSKRQWMWIAGLFLVLLLGILFLAPTNRLMDGSSYGRSPDGYAGWYAYMQQQGVTIERWQQPYRNLTASELRSNSPTPATFLQVYGERSDKSIPSDLIAWVSQGNRLVILAQQGKATEAPFWSSHATPAGTVKIATTRRLRPRSGDSPPREDLKEALGNPVVLGDRYGGIVIRERRGKGEIIRVTTPYLAANAYQDQPANYAYLAQLVGKKPDRIWMDEYLHGYKDAVTREKETRGDLIGYLTSTPFLLVVIQGFVVVGILVYAKNRRFGAVRPIPNPPVNNSQVYIQAMAGVLQKAGSYEFVEQVIGNAEKAHLQRQLGLSGEMANEQELMTMWQNQTGRSPTDLQPLLHPRASLKRESDVLFWLQKWSQVRKMLDRSRS